MRNYINIMLLLFWTTFTFGQLLQRQPNETAAHFAERTKPENAVLTHKVSETKWNNVTVIIALYNQPYKMSLQNDPDQQTYHKITGAVFIPLSDNFYSKTDFGPILPEGGDPNIESVFFANTSNDNTKELIVIASWNQKHYDVNGTLFGTFVFDYEMTGATLEWKFLKEISNKLDGGCECDWRDGTGKKAKFKTASAIKKELIRLGYKQ